MDDVQLGHAYGLRLESLRGLIEVYNSEVAALDAELARCFADHDGYRAIQALKGVGPVLAGVFVAEIGDISRFAHPSKLCSGAGLTPRHRPPRCLPNARRRWIRDRLFAGKPGGP